MTTDTKIEDRILKILEERSSITIPSSERKNFRYMEHGMVDSMNLITFIIEVEEVFDIELDPADTESDEFRTIGGLAQIIALKTA